MRRLLRDTSGANLVEAAIVTPLLVLLTVGIVDFSALFYAYLALENGVSQATRFAVTGNQTTDPNTGALLPRQASIMATMRAATPTLTIPDAAFTFSHLPQGSGSWVGGTGAPGDVERLAVDYTWSLITPPLRLFFPGGRVRLHVESAMKNEGRFR